MTTSLKDRLKFLPMTAWIFPTISSFALVSNFPDEGAPVTAQTLFMIAIAVVVTLGGVIAVLSGIMSALVARLDEGEDASGGGTQLRDDRPSEPVEP
ncbi:hypothetical protein GCM10010156_74270 [Planobispora rosea]|uniref:Uncharacterized protein n=1 Tax=Planobispora rosea TaxID=35762 RepID=A0A8J3SAD0_PLARO|nr:hypothetical protein [Planobispora rosea]GGT05731.1 hypothetical protein GCM10010156_74270 [Planobispora rosea]GIH88975.1 hypothetical protein Pro02_73830 [Planobispora rosea]